MNPTGWSTPFLECSWLLSLLDGAGLCADTSFEISPSVLLGLACGSHMLPVWRRFCCHEVRGLRLPVLPVSWWCMRPRDSAPEVCSRVGVQNNRFGRLSWVGAAGTVFCRLHILLSTGILTACLCFCFALCWYVHFCSWCSELQAESAQSCSSLLLKCHSCLCCPHLWPCLTQVLGDPLLSQHRASPDRNVFTWTNRWPCPL